MCVGGGGGGGEGLINTRKSTSYDIWLSKKLNSVNPCLADTITYLPISVTYAWGLRLITLTLGPRLSEPVALSQNS